MEPLRDNSLKSVDETHFEDLPFEEAWRYAPFSELIRAALALGVAAVRWRDTARSAGGAEAASKPHPFQSLHDPFDWHHGPNAYPK